MTASYEVIWKGSARRELRRLPTQVIRRVVTAVEALAEDPLPRGVRKLSGSDDSYRIRLGDYRVIYSLYRQQLLIEILRVAHRKEAYR